MPDSAPPPSPPPGLLIPEVFGNIVDPRLLRESLHLRIPGAFPGTALDLESGRPFLTNPASHRRRDPPDCAGKSYWRTLGFHDECMVGFERAIPLGLWKPHLCRTGRCQHCVELTRTIAHTAARFGSFYAFHLSFPYRFLIEGRYVALDASHKPGGTHIAIRSRLAVY